MVGHELSEHPALVIGVIRRIEDQIGVLVLVQGLQPALSLRHLPLLDLLRRVGGEVVHDHVGEGAADITTLGEFLVRVRLVSVDGQQVTSEFVHVFLRHGLSAVASNILEAIAEEGIQIVHGHVRPRPHTQIKAFRNKLSG